MKIISLKYLKWVSTALILTCILLTNLNYYSLKIFVNSMGAIGFSFAGHLTRDKALMTNFGLQPLLFSMGYFYYLV